MYELRCACGIRPYQHTVPLTQRSRKRTHQGNGTTPTAVPEGNTSQFNRRL
ncbi:hypothetical protein H4696_003417 [Amycolatopsis lexingtonensis]|uniref:Uncharacterized protein n=1 Tax=Amycolatopsis lexingtonensis TaxID=218822 RepID=A0ABR9HZF0_9PSEU|nr:hypothetical protein [Amycolatopsis lexingtonensis]